MNEEWKDIKGFEGLYQISNLGRVKSLKRKGNWKEVILKQQISRDGYLWVCLFKEGKTNKKMIHRMVAENFIKNTYNLPTVDHINRNRLDNRIKNLRWASYQLQNANRNPDYNLAMNLGNYIKAGKDNPKSRKVLQYNSNGELIKEYGGIREAERETKIKSQYICRCCKNKIESIDGYIWKYKEASNE